MLTLDEVADRFEGARRSGDGYRARCPSHEDRSPSLSISEADDGSGRILLHCHAGCKTEDILKEVGLTWLALDGDGRPSGMKRSARPAVTEDEVAVRDRVYRRLSGLLGLTDEHRSHLTARGLSDERIQANGYASIRTLSAARVGRQLLDEFGDLLRVVPGFDLGSDPGNARLMQSEGILIPVRGLKGMVVGCQVRTGDQGRKYVWLSGPNVGSGSPSHFVRVSEGGDHPWVVTEGPLKADVVAALFKEPVRGVVGVPGVGSWAGAVPHLKSAGAKEVLLAYDMDAETKAGVREQEAALTEALRAAGIGVKRLTWDARHKGLDDALAAGLTPKVEGEVELSTVSKVGSPGGGTAKSPPARGLVTKRLSEVRPEPIRWLVPDFIPQSGLTIIAGEGGQGKSTLTIHLAGAVSLGQAAFGLSYAVPEAGYVLLVSSEDSLAQTVVPRLLGSGADLSRIEHVEGGRGKGDTVVPFDLNRHEEVAQHLGEHPGTRLLVIDPVTAFVGGTGVDDHRDSELRSLLRPWSELAAEHNLAVVLVMHLNKGQGGSPANRILGGVGYVNTARAVFVVVRDPGDAGRRLLLPVKNNLSQTPKGLAFRMEGLPDVDAEKLLRGHLGSLGKEDQDLIRRQLYRPVWLGPVEVSAGDALTQSAKGKSQTQVDLCAAWLKNHLAANGPCLVSSLEKVAEKAGFTEDNLKEAKTKLKASKEVHFKLKGKGGRWRIGLGDPSTWPPLTDD